MMEWVGPCPLLRTPWDQVLAAPSHKDQNPKDYEDHNSKPHPDEILQCVILFLWGCVWTEKLQDLVMVKISSRKLDDPKIPKCLQDKWMSTMDPYISLTKLGPYILSNLSLNSLYSTVLGLGMFLDGLIIFNDLVNRRRVCYRHMAWGFFLCPSFSFNINTHIILIL